jgi:GcrA cell cycle regulator
MPTWTDVTIELARSMWVGGSSASEIANEIGCSRNAVIGKLHRLGLQRTRRPVRAAQPRIPRRPVIRLSTSGNLGRRPPQAAIPPVPLAIVDGLDRAPTPKSILDIGPHECRYAVGDAPMVFCGRTTSQGLPFCAGHARMAYNSPRANTAPFIPRR